MKELPVLGRCLGGVMKILWILTNSTKNIHCSIQTPGLENDVDPALAQISFLELI
jgi:hypothetical protein